MLHESRDATRNRKDAPPLTALAFPGGRRARGAISGGEAQVQVTLAAHLAPLPPLRYATLRGRSG
jgi:hypothetical protein